MKEKELNQLIKETVKSVLNEFNPMHNPKFGARKRNDKSTPDTLIKVKHKTKDANDYHTINVLMNKATNITYEIDDHRDYLKLKVYAGEVDKVKKFLSKEGYKILSIDKIK